MDLALAIESLVPAAEYGGSTTKNTKAAYDALDWKDARAKPSWAAIQAAYAALPPVVAQPYDIEVRLKALEQKAGITAADKEAARLALKGGA